MSRSRRVRAVLAVAALSCVALTAARGPAAAVTVPSGTPSGHLDAVKVPATGPVVVAGWAADPNSAAPVRVSLVLDGGVGANLLAAGRRNDVALRYPGFGAQRGYIASIAVPAGKHTLCVDAVNVGAGRNARLGCRTITVPGSPAVKPAPPAATRSPIGHLDNVTLSAGTLTFTGWTIDPDTVTPALVDLTANGVNLGSVAANRSRSDIARLYARYGSAHGLRATVPAPGPGNYLICAIAVNTAAGPGRQLGCKFLTVLPATEPAVLNTATATAAANALQARAIASHAAKATDFPAGASSAARIAIAARALLQQAAGLRAAPPANTSLPAFTKVTPTRPVDEQAVMGASPDLGNYPAARTGGRTGRAHAVERFANDALPAPYGAGDGLIGAAPVLPANGKTVRPTLPAYPATYTKLRAEVALDAALAQLGVPYVWAAAGPDSFDCSGLTEWAWAKAGVDLYHYTVTQSTQGVRVKPNQLLPGDLVLFGADLHHVGMYLGAGYMIDAPYTGAYVRVDKISGFGDFTLAVRP